MSVRRNTAAWLLAFCVVFIVAPISYSIYLESIRWQVLYGDLVLTKRSMDRFCVQYRWLISDDGQNAVLAVFMIGLSVIFGALYAIGVNRNRVAQGRQP
jgi:hypothetical protein